MTHITAEQAQKQLDYWLSSPGHGPAFVDFELVAIALIASESARKLAEERLGKAVAALKPFANCVFNDNGDVTVSYGYLPGSAFVTAHFTIKEITE